ncbi:MAG TPA: universal stress protein [Pyrinomonadaceae bacterium]|nr:universal stress protein [Pyrinomonadaceae bacterium]
MRVLIGYEGSEHSGAAIDDLRRAGLPRDTSALVATVSHVNNFEPPLSGEEATVAVVESRVVKTLLARAYEDSLKARGDAHALALEACDKVRSIFPEWEVRPLVLAGAPDRELISEAERWDADLILVCPHERSALGRLFFGSVSKKVAAGAGCTVRVARPGFVRSSDTASRIVVGVDGSSGSERAVRAVGERVWPHGTEARLVAVDDGSSPVRLAGIIPSTEPTVIACNEMAAVKTRMMLEWADKELRAVGLNVSIEIKEGVPLRTLIEEAHKWEADSIFVGSRGLGSGDEAAGLGQVAAGLVTDAHCSVEISRQ